MAYLSIQKISKSYIPELTLLNNFSLEIEKGQVVALVGESGSGKSTLLRIIAGLENKDSGEVFIGDLKIQSPNERLVPGYDEVQLVYQDYHLYQYSTVEENIKRPLLLYDKDYKNNRIKTLLNLLGLEKLKEQLPKQLSGGQQQKVAIGRALSIEPQVLLLDEPFSNLDTIQRRELIAELKTMFAKLEVTVIFVTHDLDDALQMSSDLVILQDGKLIQHGKPEEIFSNPKNLYAAKLFSHLNPLPENPKKYIRPSDVMLYKTAGLKAKILGKQYLVHFNQLLVRLPNGNTWLVEDKKRVFEVGDLVYLKWDSANEIGSF